MTSEREGIREYACFTKLSSFSQYSSKNLLACLKFMAHILQLDC